MQFHNAPAEIKSVGDSGVVEGYFAVKGNIDLGGDVLEGGAFKEIHRGRNGKIKMLNQHAMRDPIGGGDMFEDSKGYEFKGQLVLEAPSAKAAHALAKAGVLDGLSFGYDVLPGGAEILNSGVRMLKGLKLWEISLVTFGMNPLAGVDSVKTAGQITTIREFEDFLRDVGGYTNAQAKALAVGGFRALQSSRDENGGVTVKQLFEGIGTISLE